MKNDNEDRRKGKQPVIDGPVKFSININNLLTSLLITVMIWIGDSINNTNKLLENHNVRIDVIEKLLEEHIEDYKSEVLFNRQKEKL